MGGHSRGRRKYGLKYGQITLSDEQVTRLRELSSRLGGWVWFNDDLGSEFIELERWRVMYEQWLEQRIRG